MVTREKALKMLEDYLNNKINKEEAHKWANNIVFSKEFQNLDARDKLLSDTIQILWELHHEGDEEIFNPTINDIEYYRDCLLGKIDFEN